MSDPWFAASTKMFMKKISVIQLDMRRCLTLRINAQRLEFCYGKEKPENSDTLKRL